MDANDVLEIFKDITRIPRESGHEAPITQYLQDWAADHHLACKTDETGNVLITREAAPGKENVPTLVLQAHQDMVCEKVAGSKHDFRRDPIPYFIRDGWMISEETTLGADDGIGIAACLALLESDLPTGKLECLFTISEETGMDGAEAMKEGFFTGKTLINLDSEDEGQLFIGCAGKEVVRLFIGGAQGGHSGDDINKGRVNAIQQMVRFLYIELKKGIQVISIDGGNKPNAIARECEVLLATPEPDRLMVDFARFDDLAARFGQLVCIDLDGAFGQVVRCHAGHTTRAGARSDGHDVSRALADPLHGFDRLLRGDSTLDDGDVELVGHVLGRHELPVAQVDLAQDVG